MFIWIFAAITVFLLSLIIAIVGVEKEKRNNSDSDEMVSEKGEGILLSKPVVLQPIIGHGQAVNILEPAEAVELIDDKQHSHEEIIKEVSVGEPTFEAKPVISEDEDEIVPRYMEEEMNDKEQSKKLAGEIDL